MTGIVVDRSASRAAPIGAQASEATASFVGVKPTHAQNSAHRDDAVGRVVLRHGNDGRVEQIGQLLPPTVASRQLAHFNVVRKQMSAIGNPPLAARVASSSAYHDSFLPEDSM